MAKLRDVAGGTQAGKFEVGDRAAVQTLDDLDPVYRALLDEPVTAAIAVIGDTGRANLTAVWFDYEGNTVLVVREVSEDDPEEGPRVTAQLNRVFAKYTGGDTYALRDPSIEERRVLFELAVDSVATFGRP